MFSKSLFFIIGFLWLSLGLAFEVPALTGPVVDQAGALSREEAAQISERLHAYRQQGGPQIQVLIVPTLQGEAIEQVSIQTFDKWKLGDEKKDNGVLFLVALNDRKLRIEVGQGLEGNIPDIIAKRIVSEITRPIFKSQNYFVGIFLTTEAINQAATTPDDQVFDVYKFKEQVLSNPNLLNARERDNFADRQEPKGKGKKVSSAIVFLVLGVLWIIIFIFSPSTALWILFSLLSGGRGGGGGGRGGGGWSGGGGSSSGGGASGDW